MSSPTADPPQLCRYIESQALPACPHKDQGNGFCERHNGPRFAVCAGCPDNHGTHLCSCGSSLCGSCIHHPPTTEDPTDVGWHGPHDATSPRGDDTPTVPGVRETMINTVVLSLRQASNQGITDDFQRAAKVVFDLGTVVSGTMLAGLVAIEQQGGTQE